mmetsp:Transcript_6989/g.20539  ORF Transcript_6989/g.20539 Transcript_6989/m.20539 type:complete len:374 (+) Transcript_6989:872-1993(+)
MPVAFLPTLAAAGVLSAAAAVSTTLFPFFRSAFLDIELDRLAFPTLSLVPLGDDATAFLAAAAAASSFAPLLRLGRCFGADSEATFLSPAFFPTTLLSRFFGPLLGSRLLPFAVGSLDRPRFAESLSLSFPFPFFFDPLSVFVVSLVEPALDFLPSDATMDLAFSFSFSFPFFFLESSKSLRARSAISSLRFASAAASCSCAFCNFSVSSKASAFSAASHSASFFSFSSRSASSAANCASHSFRRASASSSSRVFTFAMVSDIPASTLLLLCRLSSITSSMISSIISFPSSSMTTSSITSISASAVDDFDPAFLISCVGVCAGVDFASAFLGSSLSSLESSSSSSSSSSSDTVSTSIVVSFVFAGASSWLSLP